MAKLGKIKIVNEKESDNPEVEVTSYPVERGIPITDHVQRKPEITSISGFLLGKNPNKDFAYLKKQMYAGKLLNYTGRKVAKNVVITNLSRDIGEYKNGFAISVELQEIRIAKSPFVKKKVKAAGKKKKSNTKKKSAVYHKVKKGETYSHMRMWYGTSLSQLRKWNKYPDRRIPIGVKLRVK